ncbi:MAG TPA: 50S ribosomal protein L24 [Candidatus Paceibacterota bacterium]
MIIHKGDTVHIRNGKDRGKTGKVIKVYGKNSKVLIEGINVYKKHSRPKRQGEKGEIISLPKPLDISRVMLYCSFCKKGVRVGHKLEEAGAKTRFCRKCKSPL